MKQIKRKTRLAYLPAAVLAILAVVAAVAAVQKGSELPAPLCGARAGSGASKHHLSQYVQA